MSRAETRSVRDRLQGRSVRSRAVFGLRDGIWVALALVTPLAHTGCSGTKSMDAPAPRAAASPTAQEVSPMQKQRYQKPSLEVLKQKLTPLQFKVTQEEGTEPPFRNDYWDNHREGLYVDVVTGEPLFSSRDKFDSGTGWPSFTRPLAKEHVVEKSDVTLGMVRTEVRSAAGGSHLGHVFDDGPQPTGLRYCINSAALRFIPVSELEAQGYGDLRAAFAEKTTQTR